MSIVRILVGLCLRPQNCVCLSLCVCFDMLFNYFQWLLFFGFKFCIMVPYVNPAHHLWTLMPCLTVLCCVVAGPEDLQEESGRAVWILCWGTQGSVAGQAGCWVFFPLQWNTLLTPPSQCSKGGLQERILCWESQIGAAGQAGCCFPPCSGAP